MSFFLTCNDQRLTAVRLRVPARGPWVAELDFEGEPAVAGSCTLVVGKLTLVGMIQEQQAGSFAKQRKARVVAGGGGWSVTVSRRGYHNDAGIKSRLLADDLAREVGETIAADGFAPEAERVGMDYARGEGVAASAMLEDVIGNVPWWVDAAGVTRVGTRPTAPTLAESDYQVSSYDPRDRVAALTVTDPSLIVIGSRLAGPSLPEPQLVREYEVQADASGVRVFAWCGSDERSAGRLTELVRAVVERALPPRLFGLYLYRVVNLVSGGRLRLQPVRRELGLPDLDPISQWPGVPGAAPSPALGSEVLVAFIDGDRSQPIVTHYAGQGGSGFVPSELVLGGATGSPCARQNDTVEIVLPPMVFVGTVGVEPATGIVSSTLQTALGVITTGSPIVKVAP